MFDSRIEVWLNLDSYIMVFIFKGDDFNDFLSLSFNFEMFYQKQINFNYFITIHVDSQADKLCFTLWGMSLSLITFLLITTTIFLFLNKEQLVDLIALGDPIAICLIMLI